VADRGRDQKPAGESRRLRIRDDLERMGVAREFSHPVAERLAVIAPDFSSSEYAAVLDGVAAAYGVHRVDSAASGDAVEIGRLMQGFASELRKLDEGLRILCAYAERMQRRAGRSHEEPALSSTRNLH
jgi:hypothetical protein